MRIFKSFLVSCLFIPFTLIGQLIGYYFGKFTLFMWTMSVRGGGNENSIIPFFSDFLPYILSGYFGGLLSAFLITKIYKFYHPIIILIIPIIVGILMILGNILITIQVGFTIREIGMCIGAFVGTISYVIIIKEDYPPALKELEESNKNIGSKLLQKIYGNRDVSNSIKKIEGVKDHRLILKEVFETANNNIIILSGFTSKYVMDQMFFKNLKKTLEKGVNIKLCYGYKSPSRNQKKINIDKNLFDNLINIKNLTKDNIMYGKLDIYDFPNHSKVLIKDDEFVISGSYNWLSTGDDSKNLEKSYLIRDKIIVNNEIDDINKLLRMKTPL